MPVGAGAGPGVAVSLRADGGQGVPVDGERVGVEGAGTPALLLVSLTDWADQLDAVSGLCIQDRIGGDVSRVGQMLDRN